MKVVYVDMIADLFHYGHVLFLQKAKSLGDYLIVGIQDDEFTTNYKRKPILTLDERCNVVESCKYVDKVIRGAPTPITMEFLNENEINLVCHAHDISEHDKYKIYYEVPINLGIFKRLDYTNSISTTDIINRIKLRN